MEMQKLQARAALERMVYNYALLGTIENGTAERIVSYIDSAIGGGYRPAVRGKIIAFPAAEGAEPHCREEPSALPDEEEEKPPFSEWRKAFSAFDDYEYGDKNSKMKILTTLHHHGINSLEELARTAPDKIRRRHYVGDQSLAVIRSVLEKNGFFFSGEKEEAAQ